MFRFTDRVRGSESVRDVKQRYPETEPIDARFGLRTSCVVDNLLMEVNEAIQQARSVTV